jgi:hypothetical protein
VNSDAVQNVNYWYDLQVPQPLIELRVPNKKTYGGLLCSKSGTLCSLPVPRVELKVGHATVFNDERETMKRENLMLIAVLFAVAVLFVSAIAGTIFYCNRAISAGNSKIASLNGQIANLNSQVANLTSVNIVTALGVAEVPANSPNNCPTPLLYNHLYISGSVTNTGEGTAYNAGLHVVAREANGKVEVDMTVPLDGPQNVTGNEITDYAPVFGTDAKTQIYGNDSLQLGNLFSGQTLSISLGIFHEGTVTSWTITPVWTRTATPTTLILAPKPTPTPKVITVITSVTFNNENYDFGPGGASESIPDTSMAVGANYTLVIKVTDYEASNQSVTLGMIGFRESFSGTDGVVLLSPSTSITGLGVLPSGNCLTLAWNVEALAVGAANPVLTITPSAGDYYFQNATLSFPVTVK